MNLLETLEKTFNKKPNFITANGELEKWVIINKAQKYDEELIELLLSEKELKDKFFKKLTLKQQKEHLCELLDKTQLFCKSFFNRRGRHCLY